MQKQSDVIIFSLIEEDTNGKIICLRTDDGFVEVLLGLEPIVGLKARRGKAQRPTGALAAVEPQFVEIVEVTFVMKDGGASTVVVTVDDYAKIRKLLKEIW